MITTSQVAQLLDEALSDSHVLNAFHENILSQAKGDFFEVKFEGSLMSIPISAPVSILTKVFIKQYLKDTQFGDYRVQVGIGDITNEGHGIIFAQYCFATLYFSEFKDVITCDFHVLRQ